MLQSGPQREASVGNEAQRYRSLGYKVIAIVGLGGSGKSTFGNLYCGHTDRAPFRVEHGQGEGTLETTGYANHTTRIYWLDTRGFSPTFDYRQWMGMMETLGDIHGLVIIGYPQQRVYFGQELGSFLAYVNAEGFPCLKVFREDLASVVDGFTSPHMYEGFLPFHRDTRDVRIEEFIAATAARPDTFCLIDVQSLTTRVIELRGEIDHLRNTLGASEAANAELQTALGASQATNAELQTARQASEAELRARNEFLEKLLHRSRAENSLLNTKFTYLEEECRRYLRKTLKRRSRVPDRLLHDVHQYKRRGLNHVASLVLLLSGQFGAVLLNEKDIRNGREDRDNAFALQQVIEYVRAEMDASPAVRAVLSPGPAALTNATPLDNNGDNEWSSLSSGDGSAVLGPAQGSATAAAVEDMADPRETEPPATIAVTIAAGQAIQGPAEAPNDHNDGDDDDGGSDSPTEVPGY
eukprot:gene8064-5807_t